MKKYKYSKGDIFGSNIFIKEVFSLYSKCGIIARRALFQCRCGKEFISIISHIKNLKVKSCGCYKIERITKHGKRYSELYGTYSSMISRCYNKNNESYKYYGGRNISVCEEWKNDISKFINWSYQNGYKNGLNIDRVNNNGNYEPSNCRFVTTSENNRNKRSNVFITFNNKTMCLKDWSNELNINFYTLRSRLKSGWDLEKTFTPIL